jgi:hypothetical protein
MDDRRIARALADMDAPDAAERARRRRARGRIFLRIIAILCLIAGVALAALLLRPLPNQAELQYTQGKIRQAGWSTSRWPRFEIGLHHESRAFAIDQELAERGGRKLSDIAQPGKTARIGYAGGARAWDLAIDDKEIYSLADIRARAAAESPPYWFAALTLLAIGAILFFLTPRPRRHSHRHRRS